MSALVVLFGVALTRGGALGPGDRALVAVAASSTVCVCIQLGAFSSEFSKRVIERNSIVVAPLVFLVFALWLHRGLPRPRRLAIAGAALPAVLLLMMPWRSLLDDFSILADTVTLIPFAERFDVELVPGGPEGVRWMLGVAAALAGLAFVRLRRGSAAVALPALVAAFLLVVNHGAYRAIRDYSAGLDGVASARQWVDDELPVGERAAYLYVTTLDARKNAANWVRLWETEFWNRDVGSVYYVGKPDPYGPLIEQPAVLDRTTGLLAAPGIGRYIVTDSRFRLAGRLLGRAGNLSLYQANRPLRLREATEGVASDSWAGGRSSYTRYVTPGGRSGRIRVTVSRKGWAGPDVPGDALILVGDVGVQRGVLGIVRTVASRVWVVRRLRERTFTLPTPRPPFRVEVLIAPTFNPSVLGGEDKRDLGAQLHFEFLPRKAPRVASKSP
jgi:hypothetical protein